MRDKLKQIQLRNVILKYAQNKSKLNELLLDGKYLWEVDLPNIVTTHTLKDTLSDKLFGDYADGNIDKFNVCLKVNIQPMDDNEYYMISVYDINQDKLYGKGIGSRSFTHRFSYYEKTKDYGKTWWILNYNHRQELNKLLEETKE